MEDYLWIIFIIVIILINLLLLKRMIEKSYKKGKEDGAAEIFEMFLVGAYESRVNWFKTANKYVLKDAIVFVGDSLTNEYMLTEMFPNKAVYNRGIGGDTTDGILNRMNESIFDLNPKKVFLQIGANDYAFGKSMEYILENVTKIVHLVKEKNIDISVISMYPVNTTDDPKISKNDVGIRANELIIEYNKTLKAMCEKENIQYIDMHKHLIDSYNQLKLEYTREGLHISPKGYEVITSVLNEYL